MSYEIFARVCVGAPLKPEAARELHADFLRSLGLDESTPADAVFERLRFDTPKHKLHEPDRVRYERALEAFVDERCNADFAIGGLSPDGLFEPRKGYLFVGVRVEGFEFEVAQVPKHGAAPERPQWLRKGDLSIGSELAKALGPDVRKPFEHACRSYSRAAKEILKDATARARALPVAPQHEPDWALCRWLVDAAHPSVLHRHGRGQ